MSGNYKFLKVSDTITTKKLIIQESLRLESSVIQDLSSDRLFVDKLSVGSLFNCMSINAHESIACDRISGTIGSFRDLSINGVPSVSNIISSLTLDNSTNKINISTILSRLGGLSYNSDTLTYTLMNLTSNSKITGISGEFRDLSLNGYNIDTRFSNIDASLNTLSKTDLSLNNVDISGTLRITAVVKNNFRTDLSTNVTITSSDNIVFITYNGPDAVYVYLPDPNTVLGQTFKICSSRAASGSPGLYFQTITNSNFTLHGTNTTGTTLTSYRSVTRFYEFIAVSDTLYIVR